MSALEIGILIGAVALVAFTVIFNLLRKRKGRSGCACAPNKTDEKSCSGSCARCGADCPYSKR